MRSWIKRHLRTVLPAIAIVVVIPAYLQAFSIHGPSEAPTILLGDRVIVNKAAYVLKAPYTNWTISRTGSPKRGDLIAFLVPNRGVGGVKRVIGIPGDSVKIQENRVIVNGQGFATRPLDRADFG
jgi:signal peptidase I